MHSLHNLTFNHYKLDLQLMRHYVESVKNMDAQFSPLKEFDY